MRTKNGLAVAIVGLALAATVSLAGRASGADDDLAGVKKQCAAFVDAWNKHDAKALGALFAEDGDAINPHGRHASGRAEVEKMFAEEHGGQGALRESTVSVERETVRFPAPGIAVSDADITVTGIVMPDGKKMGPTGFHVVDVWKKSGDAWLVYACRPYMKQGPPAAPPVGAR
jgi:uncharacterized protein (TIGR02246 family)